MLGLLHQHWFDEPKRVKGKNRKARLQRWRKSQTWSQAIDAIDPLSHTRVIHVADREADDLQTFHACLRQGHGFVIRSQHNRRLSNVPAKLREHLARQPVVGTVPLDIPRRSGRTSVKLPPKRRHDAQPMRQATLAVRHARVSLSDGLTLQAVWVSEIDPPAGIKPVDWLLLTSEPVTCLAQALCVVDWYRQRWLIEELHKAQKTGCRLEDSQLHTAAAFTRLAAITAIIAVGLLQQRDAAEDPSLRHQPAAAHFDPLLVQLVILLTRYKAATPLTVEQLHRRLAQLGGFLGRKHDGRPGWQSLWRGWHKLQSYTAGIELYKQLLTTNEDV